MAYRLLFVCLGNICRSPSGENIMNHLLKARGLDDQVTCDSAGTSGYHIGAAPDRRMNAAAVKKLGVNLTGRSRKFESVDFENFDLILAMDQDNFEQMAYLNASGNDGLRPTGGHRHKLYLICEFCTRHDLKEVPDPYYGGEVGFDFVIDLLMDACEGLLEHLIETGKIKG